MNKKSPKFDALIIAGGFGTRMSRDFPGVPKPLIPVCDVPILEYLLYECKANGIINILISVYYEKEKIIAYIGDGSRFDLNIDYIIEEEPVGTGGALFLAKDYLQENFFVLYADVYTKIDFNQIFQFHLRNSADVTCVVHPNDHPSDSDLVEVNQFDDIIKILPKNTVRPKFFKNCAVAALYCFSKNIFKVEVNKLKFDIATDLLPKFVLAGLVVKAYHTVEYIKDMGSPNRLSTVESAVRSGIPEARSNNGERSAVILDRDGTINIDRGYVSRSELLDLVDGAGNAIRAINCSKHLALCATNQPVVARGEVTPDGLTEIHKKLDTQLGQHGAFLDDLIYCPHHPESGFDGEVKDLKFACNCRKPKSGMLDMYVEKYRLDRRKSIMVGDRFSDIKAADAGCVNSILLLSGSFNKQIEFVCRPTSFANCLPDATDWILGCFDDLFNIANDIYNTRSYSNAALLLRGESQSNCLSVARILQQHFLPNSIIFDFLGELKVNQGCKNTTENKILNMSKKFLSSHKIEYNEVVSCHSSDDLWFLPPSELNHSGSIIIPIGGHGEIDGLETIMPTYSFEISTVTF